MHRICTHVLFHFVFIALVIFLCTVFWEQRPPTFPLGAVEHLRLLAMLQVRMRMRQDVVGWGGAQQLLGAAAVQAVLAAVGGSDFFRGATQTPALPAEGAPGGAGSLTDGAARNHREVLTETERCKSDERNNLHLIAALASGMPHRTASPDWYFCYIKSFLLVLFLCFFLSFFFQVYLAALNPFSSDLSPPVHTALLVNSVVCWGQRATSPWLSLR